uniref:Uncharacterized protein n=1 Tax=Anguilla anguilla TaxID=7936 RepID=A0A0E9UZ05_ANGAN
MHKIIIYRFEAVCKKQQQHEIMCRHCIEIQYFIILVFSF